VQQSWSVPATPESVAELRRAVVDFACQQGVGDPPLSSVRIAVSEAVTNVVVHSYREQPTPGDVELRAEIRAGELHITVSDRGLGFNPRFDSPGAGLGLPVLAQITDGFEIRNREPRGTEVRFHFTL
jgi:anti-sigma regulatory factor (Ser/Thr protein kinase)